MQSFPQLIPAGLLVTVPVPLLETVRDGLAPNVAVTDLASLIVTVHDVPEPVQAPVHPVKDDVASAVAVSVTTVPTS